MPIDRWCGPGSARSGRVRRPDPLGIVNALRVVSERSGDKRSRICLALCLLAHLACSPTEEPEGGPAIRLQPRPAQASLGPPTTLRLVLQVQPDGQVRLISSSARRGSIDAPPEAKTREDANEGRVRLVDYVGRDAAGAVVVRGQLTIPATAVAEFQDQQVSTRIRRGEEPLPTPTVRVSVPYQPSLATISFERLEPNRDAPIEAWKRIPMGEVSVAKPPSPQAPPEQGPPSR